MKVKEWIYGRTKSILRENGNNYIEVNIVNNKQKGEEITNAIK